MDKKVKIFNKLRCALSIAVPLSNKGLNDDGQQVTIKSIEGKVQKFRQEIMLEKAHRKDDYKGMLKPIDKYWDKLFADPVVVNTPAGQLMIHPQRTNNILERFFRDLKRSKRKKSGMVLDKLEAEKKNNERISPDVKKIIRRPDFPERLAPKSLLSRRKKPLGFINDVGKVHPETVPIRATTRKNGYALVPTEDEGPGGVASGRQTIHAPVQ